MVRVLTKRSDISLAHVAGPVDTDGFQRCLRCDAAIPKKRNPNQNWRTGESVVIFGRERQWARPAGPDAVPCEGGAHG